MAQDSHKSISNDTFMTFLCHDREFSDSYYQRDGSQDGLLTNLGARWMDQPLGLGLVYLSYIPFMCSHSFMYLVKNNNLFE